MIKFEKTEVMNFRGALRGMRNPMNSWDKSDSVFVYPNRDNCEGFYGSDHNFFPPKCPLDCEKIHFKNLFSDNVCFEIGESDLALMKRLIKSGSDHRKFMRQILVCVDITAPLYWWKEFDTYKVGTVANSCSTMHKIHAKEFTLDDFSYERMTADAQYSLEMVIGTLNNYRKEFIECKSKDYWYSMIQLLPSSYNQKRTVTLNYETLYNIYGSRKNHKLDEWRVGFINWIESLPYAKELIIEREA